MLWHIRTGRDGRSRIHDAETSGMRTSESQISLYWTRGQLAGKGMRQATTHQMSLLCILAWYLISHHIIWTPSSYTISSPSHPLIQELISHRFKLSYLGSGVERMSVSNLPRYLVLYCSYHLNVTLIICRVHNSGGRTVVWDNEETRWRPGGKW